MVARPYTQMVQHPREAAGPALDRRIIGAVDNRLA
jgi:hypothetical protein